MTGLGTTEIEARLELRRLVDEYALAGDAFDNERYGALFTEDATFTAGAPRAEPMITANGVHEISKIPDANRVFEQTFHAVHNHVVDIDGDQATGVTYCVARHMLRGEDGNADVITTPIRYHDSYVRTDSGWKFASRRIEFTWVERTPVDPEGLGVWTA